MCTQAIIDHLQSMCEGPAVISVDSTIRLDDDAIFVTFSFRGEGEDGAEGKSAAVYYPETDLLFTPRDWQGDVPAPDTIEDYDWMGSAGDPALVVGGLPTLFLALRDDARREYGRRVAAARADLGISTHELARRAGLQRAHISRIEAGRYNVTLDTMTRLAAVLGLTDD